MQKFDIKLLQYTREYDTIPYDTTQYGVVGRIILLSSFADSVLVPLSISRLPRALPSCLQQSSADVSTCRAEAVIVLRERL